MQKSLIRDAKLAPSGQLKIDWAQAHMPLLLRIGGDFSSEKPFWGKVIAMSIHLEAKTACLALLFKKAGAEVFCTGSNPLSTQDDVAAALAENGVAVFAWHNATEAEYYDHIERCLAARPHIIIDDGGDMVHMLHKKRRDLAERVLGGCEETTTGVNRLLALERRGELLFPMVAVNNARMKHFFDNRLGTGQSVLNAIMSATNLLIAGKTVVIAGFGWCGRGIAARARGMGAKVIVTEVDPVRAVEAALDGYDVMTMDGAAEKGDIFITVTGCSGVITGRHFTAMKDGAVVANAGHFDIEADVRELREISSKPVIARKNIEGYRLQNGRTIYLVAEGRLVNLAAGDGHPVEIMDMSFAVQALSAANIAKGRYTEKRVYEIEPETDRAVALLKLETMGIKIDELTEEQRKYLQEG